MKKLQYVQWIVVVSAVLISGQTNGAIHFDETTNAGKDFFLALFNTFSQPPEIVLLIDTPSSDSASYTVETVTGLIAKGEVNDTIHHITLSSSLQVGSSGYPDREKGIRVSATGNNPIIVLVTMTFSTYLPLGLDTYKVHQNVENEVQIYEYYALSTDYNGQELNRKSEVLLVGNHNDTVVSITPTQTVNLPEDAQNPAATLVSVAPGTTHNVTLNQFQTLLVFNPTYDITGTRIVSNKPLTVLTGHQCAQFPTSATFCEPVHVQMPPTFLWGNEFLLAPFAGRTSQQQYKLVTAENSTTIVYRCGNSIVVARTLAIAGIGDYLAFPAGSYCSLFSTKPIFVVQLGAGYSTDSKGDPVMAVVPPTIRHINYTSFRVNSLFPFMTNFVSITILQEYFGNRGEHVLLDGNQLSCSWNEIYNSSGLAGYGCNISTTTGKHIITHSNNGLLSVVAYGWNKSPAWGYAFLTGMSLKVFESTEISDVQTGEVQSVSYFDLSGFGNLKNLPREQEATSPPIKIPNNLLFGTKTARSVYVNENGLFSFNEPFSFSHPNQFPTDNIYSRLRNVVAPFWSDNDIRKNGTVQYVDINIRDLTHDHENLIISEVLDHLRKTGTIGIGQEFQPTWMIVAQWDKVPPFSQESVSSKTNTYQGIIITDKVNTYYVFTYICGELQWSVGSGFDHAVVGYNSHGDYFYNTPGSGYENIADIVSCTFQVGNRRRRNIQQSSMEGSLPVTHNPARRTCKTNIKNERNGISDEKILQVLENLPECPDNLQRVRVNRLFEPDPTKAACYRSKIQFDPTNIGAQVARSYAFVQQCCYPNGGLITLGVDAGSLLEITTPEFESSFYNSCCIESVIHCPEYRKRRPINEGRKYAPPFTGSGFGEPHYQTFDGYWRIGFYGQGYYTVLKIEQKHNFTLQSDLDGLVIRSLAFGVQGVESYQFVHNRQPQVYITTDQNNPTILTFDDNGVSKHDLFQLRRRSSTSIEAIYSTKQIVLSMEFYQWAGGILAFEIQIPQSLCNDSNTTISGHLGNCDRMQENDHVPNSHGKITDNSPEVLFGNFESRKRRQAPDPSQLSNCTSVFACSENSSYVPPNFEDLTFTDAEIRFCNNISTCLYDLAVTGSADLAASTRSIDENGTKAMEILQNKLPTFNGTNIFKVTVGTKNLYTFSVKDADDNFTVTIVGGAPNGGQLVHNGEGMYSLHWMVSAIPTSSVTFRAEDARGAVVLLSPLLHVCSCFNGGTCTLDGVVRSEDSLINMTCLCTEAYGGDSCTEDRNGCSEIECFEGVECFDVPAPGVGAVCGPCPPGYTGDGLRCFDINECLVNSSSPCDQVCKNTVGSYACGCYTGFMLVSGTSQCQDINECSGVDNKCQQQCNNTVGSYLCSCQSGFHLNTDGATCSTQQVCTGENSCSHICAVIGGMEKCFCPVGLELAAGSTTNCVDINECVRFSPCDQVCNNSMGSYACSCEGGYELENMRTCQDVDECKAAALNNTQLCFNDTQCVNTPGSYNCMCVPGYILVNGKCERNIEKAAEVQIIVPSIGRNNSHTFVVETYDKSELTSDKMQAFRVATANAINRFCAKQECTLVTSSGETQSMTLLHVEPQDVAILTTMITVSSTGRLTIFFYVQEDNNTFVFGSTVSSALQDANDIYRDAGFLSKDFCGQHTPCLNGGTCTSVGSDRGYTCACAAGYTGMNCSVHIDDCAINMCLNGGTCTSVGSDSGYTCVCATGYTGMNCSVYIDDCAINVCLNGGTCTSVGSDHAYMCLYYWLHWNKLLCRYR